MADPKSKTLFSRLSQLLILMTCALFLFSLGLFRTLKDTYEKQFYKTFRETISIAVAYLEYELDRISEMTLYLSADEALQVHLRNKGGESDGYERGVVRENIKSILFKQAYREPYFSQIELDLLSGENILIGRQAGSFYSEYTPDLKLNSGYLEGKDYYFVGRQGALINVRNIRDVSNLDFFSMGTMLTYIDIEQLIRKYERQIPYYSDVNFIVVKDGEILNQNNLSQTIYESLNDSEEGFVLYKEEGESWFVTAVPGKREGWQFIGYTSLDEIESLSRMMWFGIILTHLLLALILILSGRSYVRLFTNPLEQLSRDLQVFEMNVFDITLNPPPAKRMTREIQGLYTDVELALEKIQEQVYKDYVKQISLQETQLQMLRSQINPHFLYNTLDSISWMAKSGGDKDLARMVVSLGRLLRHSLSDGRERITLKEELALLEDYLAIQKIRFQEKLQWSIAIEPDPGSVGILPFVLQPLVENAIKYGIEEGEGRLSIKIRIEKVKGVIRITVCDGGQGFPGELLALYKDKGMAFLVQEKLLGVGLRNIYRRIQLFYKGQGSLVLYNKDSGGACCILEFPLERSEENR